MNANAFSKLLTEEGIQSFASSLNPRFHKYTQGKMLWALHLLYVWKECISAVNNWLVHAKQEEEILLEESEQCNT